MIRVSEEIDAVEPGDVMVIDIHNPRAVICSDQSHSTLVAGVYSTKPGYLGSENDWDQVSRLLTLDKSSIEGEETAMKPVELGKMINEIPLAIVGIVPCKVTAYNGAIKPGDLLVTSPVRGHAMRAEQPKVGTIVGKALGSLASGQGVIKILVTLQ